MRQLEFPAALATHRAESVRERRARNGWALPEKFSEARCTVRIETRRLLAMLDLLEALRACDAGTDGRFSR
jgi:hypothetical protein